MTTTRLIEPEAEVGPQFGDRDIERADRNLTALDDAVSLPVLRPLIGHDKIEIIDEARRIRTLALSELPDQDCCTLLSPRQAETQARIDDLRRIEAGLDAADLAEELATIAQEYRPDHS